MLSRLFSGVNSSAPPHASLIDTLLPGGTTQRLSTSALQASTAALGFSDSSRGLPQLRQHPDALTHTPTQTRTHNYPFTKGEWLLPKHGAADAAQPNTNQRFHALVVLNFRRSCIGSFSRYHTHLRRYHVQQIRFQGSGTSSRGDRVPPSHDQIFWLGPSLG
jgi:hypothetical protein